MNPGYLSYVLISMLLILLASGWKDILFHGVTRTSILLFFVGWIPASFIQLSLGGVTVSLVIPFLLAACLGGSWKMDTILQRGHVWSAGILLGLFDLIMRELDGWNLIPPQYNPAAYSALALAVLAAVMARGPLWQFIALSVGLVTAELLYAWLNRTSLGARTVGGPAFSDHWWYALCLARGLTVLAESGGRLWEAAMKQRTKR